MQKKTSNGGKQCETGWKVKLGDVRNSHCLMEREKERGRERLFLSPKSETHMHVYLTFIFSLSLLSFFGADLFLVFSASFQQTYFRERERERERERNEPFENLRGEKTPYLCPPSICQDQCNRCERRK